MARMAVCACKIIEIVFIPVPAKAGIGGMAIDAQTVLNVDRCRRTGAENRAGRSAFLAATNATGVITGRAVAGLALQLAVTEGAVWISRIGVCTAKYGQHRLIVVASQTGVCALAAVGSFLTNSGADGQD